MAENQLWRDLRCLHPRQSLTSFCGIRPAVWLACEFPSSAR
ncbi:hypothetical protein TELCIR_23418 [Teladorsagia circumcincta]|uniref:Uncharacterized protein n=1 Tax=Teladorsagia circumcincta TaxID=45464 RepID=A0A2G9TB48_TELCI|nr:hypothetical protein TELCIR_23418 [Teladorsagia circumcincta]